MQKYNKWIFKSILIIIIVIVFYILSLYNYVLFHSLDQIICIVISCSIFLISISSVEYSKSEGDYISYIGISYVFVAFLDTLHMLSYKGNSIFKDYEYYGNQLSIATWYIQSISLFISLFFLKYKKKMKLKITLVIYSIITVTIVLSIFYYKTFPICHVNGKGQTNFKLVSECIVSLILITTALFIRKNNDFSNRKVDKYIFLTIIFMIIAQVTFIISNDSNGILSPIAHCLKIISLYILFKAVAIVRVLEPNRIANNELEERIQAINKYNYLFNSIDEAFCIIEFVYDLSGTPVDYRYIKVNPAFKKHTGISNALGSRASQSAPYKTENLIKVYSEVVRTGIPTRYIFEAKEVQHWFSLYAFKINNQDSVRVAVLFRDITEEVKARNDLENSIKMQEEIFANISHELKTPLNVIYSTVQLLELYSHNNSMDANINKVKDRLNIIKQNCYRFTKLINNIVDLSKMDSGFMKYNIKNGNIVEVVENIVQSISEFVKENQLTIIFDTDIEEKIIAFDADKIERVMLNLISNAIKFSNLGGIIYVNISDKGDFIEISVKDTGVGIEEEYLQSIFERFHQVDKTLSRNAEGTGIGLSLVKSIIDMHGGKISLESELGNGSTFKIQIPVLTVKNTGYDQQISTNNDKVEMINIEFSDIYKSKEFQ